jgi:hypothetical protein
VICTRVRLPRFSPARILLNIHPREGQVEASGRNAEVSTNPGAHAWVFEKHTGRALSLIRPHTCICRSGQPHLESCRNYLQKDTHKCVHPHIVKPLQGAEYVVANLVLPSLASCNEARVITCNLTEVFTTMGPLWAPHTPLISTFR